MPAGPLEDTLDCEDLDQIGSRIRGFKSRLHQAVEGRRGISRLSALTAIPEPALARFFKSAAMPRKITLNKIARALNLNQGEIETEWSV